MPVTYKVKSEEIPGSEITPQYVNRFHVVVDALHTRIIFGDAAVGLDATFHSVVVMSTSDALELARVLHETIETSKGNSPQTASQEAGHAS